jgi:hypothetical protein
MLAASVFVLARHVVFPRSGVGIGSKKVKDTVEKTKQNALNFFQPRPPAVPSPSLITP